MCFVSLFVTDIGSGDLSLKTRWYVFGGAGVAIEIINQITFGIARHDARMAALLKCCLFWAVFLCSALLYVILSRQSGASFVFSWPGLGDVGFYAVLSWVLPNYSVSPEYRFLLLRGRFRKRR
jgi:hypothetical protein